MATSATHRGWKYDAGNGRLQALFNGHEAFNLSACGCFAFSACVSVSAPGGNFTVGREISGSTAAIQGILSLASTNACGGNVSIKAPSTATTWALTLPADDGNCGQQLTTNGSGVTSWAAACSTAASKDILGVTCKGVAYEQIRNAPIYDFEYKPGRGFKATHPYTGIVAEESPWAMQGGENHIFSPINAFGKLTAAFQVLAEKVEKLEARA